VRSHRHRWLVLAGLVAVAVPPSVASAATPARPDFIGTGPSTQTLPYVRPVAAGVDITSLLTVDDAGSAGNGYEMVGIPDGIGAFGKNDNIVVYMNHELQTTQGIVRAHGQTGAFVSRLVLDPDTLKIKRGRDLIQPGIRYWDYISSSYSATPSPAGTQPDGDVFVAQPAQFNRFCSGSLTARGQLFDAETQTGFTGQLYFANEEAGDEGRLFAVTKNGRATQLPRLGLFSWENTLAALNTTDTTLVMGNEDSSAGQLWAYVGQKASVGSAVRRAGLTNGANFVIDLLDEAVDSDAEYRALFGKGSPQPFDLTEVDWDQSGAAQNAEGLAEGLTLNRIEDGAFDPNDPNAYYFLTTEGAPFSGRDGGGLWRVVWKDIEQPELGGTLELLLDGSEAPFLNKPDNMDIDQEGNLLIQEDPGLNDHLARIVAYRIADGARGVVAEFDRGQFSPGSPNFITTDEESSGILDTRDLLGPGTFLFDAQVHVPPVNNVVEYVQRGQLMQMEVTDWSAVYGS